MSRSKKEALGRQLAFLLRHCMTPRYVDLDGGWANVEEILGAMKISRDVLEQIVASDEKGRYSFNEKGNKVRANQGHSIVGVRIVFDSPPPPLFLYHGTALRSVGLILKDGLKPMGRQWVHISQDYETAIKVGKRHGQPIVLRVRARDFVNAGHELYRSANGVWLAGEIPSEYLEVYYPEEDEGDVQQIDSKGQE